MDIGVGWMLSNIYADGGASRVATSKGIDQVEIYTRAGFGELGASYRFSSNWLFGPMARFTYGTETSFSPFDFSTKTPRVFVGARIANQPLFKSGGARIGLFGLTDLNIDDRQIFVAGLSFDFILPIVKADVITEEKIVEKERIVQVEVEKERIVQVEVEKEKIVEVPKVVNTESFAYTLDGSILNFETDKDVILPQSAIFLKKLGEALAVNATAWSLLEIQGHTDNRGDDAYNMDLSNRRAQSVVKALQDAGVDPARLHGEGLGETRPLDTDESEIALARNRRVELIFTGQHNREQLNSIFKKVREQTYIPQSCGPNGCK
jgi:outer membrane protein OmpA-like peptidoglycan-associated protein